MSNNKPINFPNNSQAEKTKQTLETLATLQAGNRMIPISADLYAELLEAKTTLAILVRACNGQPDFAIGGIVRAILNLAEPSKASGGNEGC